MRVVVALENRFVKTRNGDIYSTTVCDYSFWQRYLQVFDEVVVFARVAEIPETGLSKPAANGPNVSFISLPTFIGPWQYLKCYPKLNILARQALPKADAYILRIGGAVPSLLWHHLEKNHLPYGVEVVGDPWDSLAVGTVKSFLRPAARFFLTGRQKKQCRGAVAAAYVSEHYLQKRYPPGCWSTHYSSINLPDEAIIDEERFAKRLECLRSTMDGQRPFRICHMGSMSALYKAQDVLIEAIAICHKKGFNVELTLLGDGKYQQVFVEKAKQLGILNRVNFAGRVPPGQPVIEQLDLADIFILPSMTEGLPRSLIEAMARGLPCIGTRVGGIPELLSGEDLVASRDAGELAEKIMAVIQDQKKLRRMAQRNLKKVKEYCSSELNKRRVEFYKKVAMATKPPGAATN